LETLVWTYGCHQENRTNMLFEQRRL
jgi:hypothetical protein